MNGVLRAVGLMSGTSLDGIDIALIETDGEASVRRQASATVAYDEPFRQRLRAGLAMAAGITRRDQRPGDLNALEQDLTQLHAEALKRFLGDRMLQPSAIDVVGFHGQTVLHRQTERVVTHIPPPKALLDTPQPEFMPVETMLTVQLGDGALLAKLTGIDVAWDLRAADTAAGGQGAPLAPAYHRALAAKLPERPAAFLNIGGVANITYIAPDGALTAFDTGPGNALIDDWVLRHTGQSHDADGQLARSGIVDEDALRALLTHDYFGAGVPKSLDRNTFSPAPVSHLSPADGAATLTAFTAAAVHRALAFLPEPPKYWVVCGGGRRNKALMMALAERLEAAVAPAEAIGLDGDSLEAEAWAYLAVRSVKGLPLSYPRTTGVPHPQPGGRFSKAGTA